MWLKISTECNKFFPKFSLFEVVLGSCPLLSLKSLFDKICFILHSLYGAVGQNTFFLLLHYFYHIVLFYLDIIIIYVMKLAVKYTYMQVSSLVSLFISLQH